MMQMMDFLNQPTSLALTYPERDLEEIDLDWSKLTKHKQSLNTYNATSIENHLAECWLNSDSHLTLARLARELGYRNNANYYENVTTAYGANGLNTLKKIAPSLKFSAFTYWHEPYEELYNELETNLSIIYVEGTVPGESIGHAWVCDGGEHYTTTRYITAIDGSKEPVVTHKYYYHFNWGWCGKDNGYFLPGVFDPEKPSESRASFNQFVNYFIAYK